MRWGDPAFRIAANLLGIAILLFIAGYFFGAGRELAAAVVGGLAAAAGPELARFLVKARFIPADLEGRQGRIVDTQVDLSRDGKFIGSTIGRFVQLPVLNDGSGQARLARAYLVSTAFRQAPSAPWTIIGADEPIQLFWGGVGGIEANVPVRVRHVVNVVRAVQYPDGNTLEVCGPAVPFSIARELSRFGQYRFDIAVSAENAEPYHARLTIAWNGRTSDLSVQQE